MTFRVTRLSKQWSGLTVRMQPTRNGEPSEPAWTLTLLAQTADNTYSKDLPKHDYTMEVCDPETGVWSLPVKFTIQ